MEKFFNTAGPIKPDLHYYVAADSRWDFNAVLNLIRQEKYFILHAPRQTGKTSTILSLMHYLNKTGIYEAIYANIESAQAAREDINLGMQSILASIADSHHFYTKKELLKNNWYKIFQENAGQQALKALLSFWAANTQKPVVLLLDEVDALIGDTLISLLRQLREGYHKRPSGFPISIILCGVRDVRDYRIHSSSTKEIITGGSAFNIKAESFRLGNFSKVQIKDLYEQHSQITGQVFENGILELAWHYTSGQPWLVNALAYEVTYNIRKNQDRTQLITIADFKEAKERLILRRDTHLDQLVDKLREARVRRIIEPILSDQLESSQHRPDDVQYVRDLGLIVVSENGEINIANGIYQEVIPRALSWTIQTGLSTKPSWYIRPDGLLDMPKLLLSFQDFFRRNSEHWIEQFDYKEAGPQLLLQAYLQRIVNSGGRIEREYGLGRGRTDLFVEYFYKEKKQAVVLELKLLYSNLDQTIAEGIQQTKSYMDKWGTKEGYLLIFDRRRNIKWEEKIWQKRVEGVEVWGC